MPRAFLAEDSRGASFVEYIILVGTIALVGIVGFRAFGRSVARTAARDAECVAVLGNGCGSSGADEARATSATSAASTNRFDTSGSDSGRTWRQSHPILANGWDALRGVGTELGEGIYSLGHLAVAASAPGQIYSLYKGTPNYANETVKTLGKLALSASTPGRLVAWAGGPDPLGDAVKGGTAAYKASWHANRWYTGGRTVAFVGTFFIPGGGIVKSAETGAKIAKVGEGAAELSEMSSALRTSAEATRGIEAGNAARAADAALAYVGRGWAQDAERVAEAFPEGSPENIAGREGHFIVRPGDGAAANESPSIGIHTPRDNDLGLVFWSSGVNGAARPARIILDTKNLIGVDGEPIRNLRQVAAFSSHGTATGFASASTEQAADLSARVILSENAARAPEDKIQYLLLDSCDQGNGRLHGLGKTNAQVFQRELDKAMRRGGAGTDRVIVLASDRPGSLWSKVDEKTGSTVLTVKQDGESVPARFIPASAQVTVRDWPAIKEAAKFWGGAGAIGAVGTGVGIYLIDNAIEAGSQGSSGNDSAGDPPP